MSDEPDHSLPASGTATPAWLVQARIRWNALAARERTALTAAAWAIGLAVVWMMAVAPAWRTLREAPAQRAVLDAQFEEMSRLADEARALRGAPRLSPDQAETALRAATARLGEGAKLVMQGDHATVNLSNVGGRDLAGWLAEARAGARARPMQAQLMRGPKGYSGNVVLVIGRSN